MYIFTVNSPFFSSFLPLLTFICFSHPHSLTYSLTHSLTHLHQHCLFTPSLSVTFLSSFTLFSLFSLLPHHILHSPSLSFRPVIHFPFPFPFPYFCFLLSSHSQKSLSCPSFPFLFSSLITPYIFLLPSLLPTSSSCPCLYPSTSHST